MSTNPQPSPEQRDRTFRRVLVIFGLVLVVLVLVVVESLRNLNRSVATNDWVNHTHAVISQADAIVSSLQSAEGELHTYLMFSDAGDRVAYRDAYDRLSEHLDVLTALTRHDPDSATEVARIGTLLEQRAALANRLVRAKEAGDANTVRTLLAGDSNGGADREIRRRVKAFRNHQESLLAARDRASYLQAQETRWTVLTGLGLDLLLLVGAGAVIRHDIGTRRRAAAQLREANEQLESRVRERTAELASANRRLMLDNLETRWAKQALEHQLRYSQLVINSIAEPVVVVTKPLSISRVNPAVVHLTGFGVADLVDRPLGEFVRLEGAEDLEVLEQALAEGHDLRSQNAVLTDRRGGTHAVALSLFPVRDREKVVGGVVTLRPANSPITPS